MNPAIKSYQLIFITAFVVLFISFLPVRDTFDVHLHDTYFVINHFIFYLFLAVFLFTIGMLYEIANKILYSQVLSKAHVVLTIIAALCVIGTIYYHAHLLTAPVKANEMNIQTRVLAERLLSYSLLLLAVTQVIFFINIFTGLIRKIKAS